MKKTTNAIQAHYMIAKANVKTLEEQVDKMELAYITAHAITNADGSTPTKSWHITDDAVFNTMMNDIGDALNETGICAAQQALHDAEDALIRYGLSIMPKIYSAEKKTLEDYCFGLNGHYVHLDVREKFIDLTFKLDVSTVPLLENL
jgi:hypothetical protein